MSDRKLWMDPFFFFFLGGGALEPDDDDDDDDEEEEEVDPDVTAPVPLLTTGSPVAATAGGTTAKSIVGANMFCGAVGRVTGRRSTRPGQSQHKTRIRAGATHDRIHNCEYASPALSTRVHVNSTHQIRLVHQAHLRSPRERDHWDYWHPQALE